MAQMEKKKWYYLDRRSLSNLIVVCAGVALYMGLTHFSQVKEAVWTVLNVISPFLSGLVIAFLLNSPTDFFEKKLYHRFKYRRGMAICTVYLLTLLIIVVLLQLVLPQVGESLATLMGNLTTYLSNLEQMVRSLTLQFHLESDEFSGFVDTYNTLIKGFTSDELVRKATEFLSSPELWNIGVSVGSGVLTGISNVVNALTSLIVSVYMLMGKKRLIAQAKKLIYALLPLNGAKWLLSVGSKSNRIFEGFINGKLIDSAIIGVLCFILTTILKIPYAILVSVVVGITNVIPFFGPIIGAVPCLMILVIVDPWAALRFGVLILVLQQFDGNILGPKILGDSTGLSAIWVLVSIVVGGGLFGFLGMLLGVPTFAVIYVMVREWADHRLDEKGIDGDGNPTKVSQLEEHTIRN